MNECGFLVPMGDCGESGILVAQEGWVALAMQPGLPTPSARDPPPPGQERRLWDESGRHHVHTLPIRRSVMLGAKCHRGNGFQALP